MRKFYDPHHKPDRTPAKYRADARRDEQSARDTAEFVATFLANWKREPSGSPDPAATMKALRIEARRLGKLSSGSPKRKFKPIRPPGKGRKKTASKKAAATPRHVPKPAVPLRPYLKRKSSLRFLDLSDTDLLSEYQGTVEKIEHWREEWSETLNAKRKAALGEQIQIQLEKRADLLSIITDRTTQPHDDEAGSLGS